MHADHYDRFARQYAHESDTGLFNAHYARSAVLRLLGDVAGRRILDAGCGSGTLMEPLLDRGATGEVLPFLELLHLPQITVLRMGIRVSRFLIPCSAGASRARARTRF